jgi:hypothetical protein
MTPKLCRLLPLYTEHALLDSVEIHAHTALRPTVT